MAKGIEVLKKKHISPEQPPRRTLQEYMSLLERIFRPGPGKPGKRKSA